MFLVQQDINILVYNLYCLMKYSFVNFGETHFFSIDFTCCICATIILYLTNNTRPETKTFRVVYQNNIVI